MFDISNIKKEKLQNGPKATVLPMDFLIVCFQYSVIRDGYFQSFLFLWIGAQFKTIVHGVRRAGHD